MPEFDYVKACQEFKYDIPEQLNMGEDIVERNIRLGRQDKVAFYWENAQGEAKKFTFGELAVETNKFGNVLRSLGITKGDRILFRTPNIPEFVFAFIGALKIGAIPIPSSTLFRASEVEYRINDSESVAVFSVPGSVAEVEEVRANCPSLKHVIVVGEAAPGQLSYGELMARASSDLVIEATHKDDISFMMYTSGTTGNPKAAVHAHRYVRGHQPNGLYWSAYQEDDIVSHVGELNWIFTLLNNFLLPLWFGVPMLIYQGAGGFNPDKWFELIQKYKITNFAATPTGYRMLLTVDDVLERFDLSSLRHCISAGEPLPADTFEEWKERFDIEIMDGIGQTEVMVWCSNMKGIPIRPGSCGRPQPGFHCEVLDSEMKPLPPGQPGQLALRADTPGLLKEYWRKPDKTAEVFVGEWYLSGDTVEKDEDGYLWFKGRGDDLIKASGYRISPFEVESALASHPAVLESAAVESPDPMRGNVVKAFIVLREGFAPSEELTKEIQEHVKNVTAPYKYPRRIEYVEALPKTQSGKIKRKELRMKEFASFEASK